MPIATVLPLDPAAPEPPSEQLRAQVARRAAEGELPAGAKLPTVRGLAAELGLAVNTVAKAYRQLEAEGVVITEGRRGTFVAPSATAAAATYVAQAHRLGLTRAEAVRLVEDRW